MFYFLFLFIFPLTIFADQCPDLSNSSRVPAGWHLVNAKCIGQHNILDWVVWDRVHGNKVYCYYVNEETGRGVILRAPSRYKPLDYTPWYNPITEVPCSPVCPRCTCGPKQNKCQFLSIDRSHNSLSDLQYGYKPTQNINMSTYETPFTPGAQGN